MSFFPFAGCQQLFPVFSDAILLLCISQSFPPLSLSLSLYLSVLLFFLSLALWLCADLFCALVVSSFQNYFKTVNDKMLNGLSMPKEADAVARLCTVVVSLAYPFTLLQHAQ